MHARTSVTAPDTHAALSLVEAASITIVGFPTLSLADVWLLEHEGKLDHAVAMDLERRAVANGVGCDRGGIGVVAEVGSVIAIDDADDADDERTRAIEDMAAAMVESEPGLSIQEALDRALTLADQSDEEAERDAVEAEEHDRRGALEEAEREADERSRINKRLARRYGVDFDRHWTGEADAADDQPAYD